MQLAVVVPVKAFGTAKARLRDVLTRAERARLARGMARRVIDAARPAPTFVACDDDDVARLAESMGASVVWSPGLGLNSAVDHAVETVAGKGFDHVLIAHGDLPLASRLVEFSRPGAIVIVPDGRRDGTNVLGRPCGLHLPASYGPASFRAHLDSALATGARIHVRLDRHLSLDIDTVDDCRHPLVADSVTRILGRPVP